MKRWAAIIWRLGRRRRVFDFVPPLPGDAVTNNAEPVTHEGVPVTHTE